ncbi:MAG: transglutaminase domain-containing protein [Phycisphaerales bacterium]|nr:transglutaminase domain-containing protein [Phycisphaerales bacterium]
MWKARSLMLAAALIPLFGGPAHQAGAALCGGTATCVPAPREDYERWYTIDLGGQRAGWSLASQHASGGMITTRSDLHLSIKRGDAEVVIATEATFVETDDHKPVSIRVVQRLGAQPTTMEGRYRDDGVHVVVSAGDSREEKVVPLPEGEWLTPAAADEYVAQRLAAMPEKIVVRTLELGGGLDPMSALTPAVITRTRLESATVKAGEREASGVGCLTVSSSQPGVEAREVLDALAVPIRSETSLGPLVVVMTAAQRSVALAGGEAPELMLRTFVHPDTAIPGPRGAGRVVLRISAEGGPLPAIPETGPQSVEKLGADAARVTIDAQRHALAPASDATDPAFTTPSAIISSDDPRVKALAVSGPPGPDAAERARREVHAYINQKNLDVGFASAAEVARTRTGDCTEHAVLLAAVLRAQGIPSRVASGLVYADEFEGQRGIFAYHMWTQALLDLGHGPTWVDLDATLPDAVPFDATHVALVVSALADGQTDSVFTSLVSALGRLKIEVESVSPRP